MDPDNLVGLQNSFKRIRNPFGADFYCMYNKQPVVLRANGEWHNLIGRLQEHVARHLFMKVKYQYHDEQVKKLRMAGDRDGAKSFTIPRDVEDKIWFMITGEHLHVATAEESLQEALDLTELSKEVSKLESTGVQTGGTVVSISDVISKANDEAIAKDQGGLAHNKGAAVVAATIPPKGFEGAIDAADITAPPAPAADPIQAQMTEAKGEAAPPTSTPPVTGFGDLEQLDNNAPAAV